MIYAGSDIIDKAGLGNGYKVNTTAQYAYLASPVGPGTGHVGTSTVKNLYGRDGELNTTTADNTRMSIPLSPSPSQMRIQTPDRVVPDTKELPKSIRSWMGKSEVKKTTTRYSNTKIEKRGQMLLKNHLPLTTCQEQTSQACFH
ncbi:hypothetical protein BPAE_0076g00290 [Botrytis paeoniae]|uniref:Uncharacterized protein n=1 Tax=Botrytis paeoniae TaxID=278948 RepID=A0A4Z1FLV1_9HELO|nr:hypothetical protein BPAE_0076g00290 [Botrytis paeoniae]